MSERPIIFSGPMVRAILAGTKTQTRRVMRNPTRVCDACFNDPLQAVPHNGKDAIFGGGSYLRLAFCEHNQACGDRLRCPYGVPGDRLWVREPFRAEPTPKNWRVLYRADCASRVFFDRARHLESLQRKSYGSPVWRPSVHMPRWASRLTLEVVSVRVQRLQEISNDDARAEGVTTECEEKSSDFHGDQTRHLTHDIACHREAFERLWDSINGKRAPWASNPWVWCVEFRPAPAPPQEGGERTR